MKLADADILKLSPDHIAADPQFDAAGAAVNPFLRKLSLAIPNLLIYARLGGQDPATFLPPLRRLTEARGGLAPLSEELLESLAWQFHVDFREAAQTRAELAAMVRNSIAWHRIKGTPASMYAALALFGFGIAPGRQTRNASPMQAQDAPGRAAQFGQNRASGQIAPSVAQDARPRGIYIDEHDPGMHWATYQLGFEEVASLDDLARILKICQEMQPARCRLWRVYTDDYDYRPGVWSAKLPKYGWSAAWWSGYSGTYFPELPGADDRGLLVSFALKRRFLCEPWGQGAGLGRWDIMPIILPIRAYPLWSASYWSGLFPERLPFSLAQIIPLHGCELVYDPEIPWLNAPWQPKPWAISRHWDRRHPLFSVFSAGIPFVQECWSDATNKGNRHQPFHDDWPSLPWFRDIWPGKICKSGGWSAENSFWGSREILITADAPEWGKFSWSDMLAEPVYKRIDEFFYDYRASIGHAFLPNPEPRLAVSELMSFYLGGWTHEAWPEAPWIDPIRSMGAQILAGKAEAFLAHRWPGQSWPDSAWNLEYGGHAAIACLPGMAWLTQTLNPQNPSLWQTAMLALSGYLRAARMGRNAITQILGWRQALAPKPARFFAASAAVWLQKAEIRNPAIAAARLITSKTDALPGWPNAPWRQASWRGRQPLSASVQILAQTAKISRKPPISCACQQLATALQPTPKTCQTRQTAVMPATAGNAIRYAAWYDDGSWPSHGWLKTLGATRAQTAFSISVISEGA